MSKKNLALPIDAPPLRRFALLEDGPDNTRFCGRLWVRGCRQEITPDEYQQMLARHAALRGFTFSKEAVNV